MHDTPAEQLARWSAELRDIAAAGLHYAPTIYDRDRYAAVQRIALELLALATDQSLQALAPLRETLITRISPFTAAAAAIVNAAGEILLMRRSDTHEWALPGGVLEVGETPAEGAVREAFEETGYRCVPIALIGVYDSRRHKTRHGLHIYALTFLCTLDTAHPPQVPATHAHESEAIGWFAQDQLPANLYHGHIQRVADAYAVWRGSERAHFDQ